MFLRSRFSGGLAGRVRAWSPPVGCPKPLQVLHPGSVGWGWGAVSSCSFCLTPSRRNPGLLAGSLVNLQLGFALGYVPAAAGSLKLPYALCQGWTQQAGAVMCLCSFHLLPGQKAQLWLLARDGWGLGPQLGSPARSSTAFSPTPHHPAGSDVPGCLSMGFHAADDRQLTMLDQHTRPQVQPRSLASVSLSNEGHLVARKGNLTRSCSAFCLWIAGLWSCH